ncbi:hypothetical protein [Actinomadura sp. 9N407]|uniref:hypothetical protein n=1 Tax=Actinomadura sp. 9N407 TaxID=3375154 RepID=UPI0037A93B77
MNRVSTTLAAAAIGAGLAVTTMAAPALAVPSQDGVRAVHARDSVQRGHVVSAVHVRGFTAKQVRAWLAGDDFDVSSVRYGVDAYQVVYRTVDARKRPTTASGLLVLPRNHQRHLRTVSYTHGTMSYKPDAPSMFSDVWGPGPAVTYAAAGFAAVAPDYLGLGKGPGVHPWKHVASETTASLDMLRAARRAVVRTGRTLDRDVLVTGFSQGASSALGLARALQYDRWFRVRAVAPIAGGYDFRGAQLPAMLSDEVPSPLPPKLAVAYTSYLLTSWNRVYGLYDSPSELFQAPYADRVERFFDGTTPGQEMLAGLPGTLDELLTKDGFAMLREPSGRFAEALRRDEVCSGWTPRAPLRLYKISRDEQAVTANTDHCRDAFAASGADVPVVDVGERTYGESRHLGANVAGTAMIARWFATLG